MSSILGKHVTYSFFIPFHLLLWMRTPRQHNLQEPAVCQASNILAPPTWASSAFRTVQKKIIVYRLPNLDHFVMAAQIVQG